MGVRSDQVQDVFSVAQKKSLPAERAAYLEGACGGDTELRAQVEALLAAHDAAGDFMEQPPNPFPDLTVDHLMPAPVVEGPGAKIGRYKLLQLIGEGGFGLVFMAEQEHPVRRMVALKIIKLGMDTKQVVARFEAERQALAMMDHPNIARVLDAGATKAGRPYFVMELVKGVPITEYCDTNNLTVLQRLELFISVCRAVQHAHQKGIIHRDLKPGNVLVTLADGKPIPKVIDFGIAKATNQRLTEMTLFTEFRQFVGTPEYMSPEQAEMSSLDVDTRTDVYSLGVLLYELLTGTTPFDKTKLRQAAYEEIRRIIREVEPPRPSTRVSQLGETLASTAAHRRTEPRRLGQLMRGELDWIVMKALEKDRTRRYETTGDLAADIQRHLEHQPVHAGPPRAAYRVRKFVRRNWATLATATAILLALTVAAGALVVGTVRANLAHARAQQEMAETLERFLQQTLTLHRENPKDGVFRMGQFLKEAAREIDEGLLRDQPGMEAAMRSTIGLSYAAVDDHESAERNLKAAYDLYRRLYGHEHPHVAAATHNLALVALLKGDDAAAESQLRSALEMRRRLPGKDELLIAATVSDLAHLLFERESMTEAESMFRQVLETRRARLGPDHRLVASSVVNLARCLGELKRYGEAQLLFRQALPVLRKQLGTEDQEVVHVMRDLADAHVLAGEYVAGESILRQVLDMPAVQKRNNPYEKGETLADLAATLASQNRLDDAERLMRAALELQQRQWGNLDSDVENKRQRLAAILKAKGDTNAARDVQFGHLDALTKRADAHLDLADDAATAYYTRGHAHARRGDFAKAVPDYDRALSLNGREHWWWYQSTAIRLYLGDREGYRRHCREMVSRFKDNPTSYILERSAKVCFMAPGAMDDLSEPMRMMKQALAMGDDTYTPWFTLAAGAAEYRAGNHAAAVDYLTKAHEELSLPDAKATCDLYAAMALWQMRRPAESMKSLERAQKRIDEAVAKLGEEDLGARTSVQDWIWCQMARREAEALILGAAAPSTAPAGRPPAP